jgi:hypothetical protein
MESRSMVTSRRRKLGAAIVGAALVAAVAVDAQEQVRSPGDPIPGVSVKVGRKGPPFPPPAIAEGTTDAEGRVAFANLPPGWYWVKITVGGTTHTVTADDAGKEIVLAGPPPAAAGRAAAPAAPVIYRTSLGPVTATIEVEGGTLRVKAHDTAKNSIANIR